MQAGYTSRDIVNNSLEKEKALTLSKLYSALNAPSLAEISDTDATMLPFKLHSLLSQLSSEKHRLGLILTRYGREHYAQDPVVNVGDWC